MGSRAHEYSVILYDIQDSESIAKQISLLTKEDDQLKALDTSAWKVILKDFYKAMQMDKQGNEISLWIIILIVAIGILNTVLMSVLERKKEFGVLKAIGSRPFQIFKLIIIENTILASIAISIGFLLSWLLLLTSN